jgi:hypothetical protein
MKRYEKCQAIAAAIAHANQIFDSRPDKYPRRLPQDFASLVLGHLELRGWKLSYRKPQTGKAEKLASGILNGFDPSQVG